MMTLHQTRPIARSARDPGPAGRKLQLALDLRQVTAALAALRPLAQFIDIIECGTVLCISEGLRAVETVRAVYPDHLVVADLRIAEAASVLAPMPFEAGADWVTTVSGAAPSTFAVAARIASQYGGQIEVELSDGWSDDLVIRALAAGVEHVILKRSRDGEAAGRLAWAPGDLAAIERLNGLGARVSIAGSVGVADLGQFASLPVETFIIGRAIYADADPAARAEEFAQAIAALPALVSRGVEA